MIRYVALEFKLVKPIAGISLKEGVLDVSSEVAGEAKVGITVTHKETAVYKKGGATATLITQFPFKTKSVVSRVARTVVIPKTASAKAALALSDIFENAPSTISFSLKEAVKGVSLTTANKIEVSNEAKSGNVVVVATQENTKERQGGSAEAIVILTKNSITVFALVPDIASKAKMSGAVGTTFDLTSLYTIEEGFTLTNEIESLPEGITRSGNILTVTNAYDPSAENSTYVKVKFRFAGNGRYPVQVSNRINIRMTTIPKIKSIETDGSYIALKYDYPVELDVELKLASGYSKMFQVEVKPVTGDVKKPEVILAFHWGGDHRTVYIYLKAEGHQQLAPRYYQFIKDEKITLTYTPTKGNRIHRDNAGGRDDVAAFSKKAVVNKVEVNPEITSVLYSSGTGEFSIRGKSLPTANGKTLILRIATQIFDADKIEIQGQWSGKTTLKTITDILQTKLQANISLDEVLGDKTIAVEDVFSLELKGEAKAAIEKELDQDGTRSANGTDFKFVATKGWYPNEGVPAFEKAITVGSFLRFGIRLANNKGHLSEDQQLNDGTVKEIAYSKILGKGTFANTIADKDTFTKLTHYQVIDTVPAGLTVVVTKKDSVTAAITLTGKATNHAVKDEDKKGFYIKWMDAAVTGSAANAQYTGRVWVSFLDATKTFTSNAWITSSMKYDVKRSELTISGSNLPTAALKLSGIKLGLFKVVPVVEHRLNTTDVALKSATATKHIYTLKGALKTAVDKTFRIDGKDNNGGAVGGKTYGFRVVDFVEGKTTATIEGTVEVSGAVIEITSAEYTRTAKEGTLVIKGKRFTAEDFDLPAGVGLFGGVTWENVLAQVKFLPDDTKNQFRNLFKVVLKKAFEGQDIDLNKLVIDGTDTTTNKMTMKTLYDKVISEIDKPAFNVDLELSKTKFTDTEIKFVFTGETKTLLETELKANGTGTTPNKLVIEAKALKSQPKDATEDIIPAGDRPLKVSGY